MRALRRCRRGSSTCRSGADHTNAERRDPAHLGLGEDLGGVAVRVRSAADPSGVGDDLEGEALEVGAADREFVEGVETGYTEALLDGVRLSRGAGGAASLGRVDGERLLFSRSW